jgi:hypothetical protein
MPIRNFTARCEDDTVINSEEIRFEAVERDVLVQDMDRGLFLAFRTLLWSQESYPAESKHTFYCSQFDCKPERA